MNKGKSKKKMNSYLKMVLIMLAGGVVGGIFGFVTSYTGENSIAVIGHGMNAFLLAVRDHTVLLECICGAICIMICEIHFGKMKRMGSQIQDAEDEEYHELQSRRRLHLQTRRRVVCQRDRKSTRLNSSHIL